MAEQLYEESQKTTKKKRKNSLDFIPLSKAIDFSTIAASLTGAKDAYSRSDDVFDQQQQQQHSDGEGDAAAPAAPRSRSGDSRSDESPLRLPDLMDSKWSGGVKGVGRRSKRKPKKAKHADNDASVEEVPHGGGAVPAGAAVPAYKPVSLAQIRVSNFQLNHNVKINKTDEIDLEDTSCESSGSEDDDGESEGRENDARDDDDDDDEFAVHRKRKAAAADDAEEADPLQDEFADGDNELARRIRERARLKRRRRRSAAAHDKVASKMGRMNNCFMCAWGKRTDDSINNEHMTKLRMLLHQNVGEMPKEYIALAMHAYYKNVIRPAAQTRGQMLPVMRSKHFFICITSHNQIPEIKLAHDLEVMEIMQNFLERKIAVVPMGSTDEAPVRQLMKELRETVAIKWRLFGLPMPRMNFHRPERDIKLGSDRQFFHGLRLQKVTAKAGSALAAGGAPKLK